MSLIPVILSGGAGTRLWPVSRAAHPKPFMVLPDGDTLLQKTLTRACALPGVTRTLTVTNEQYFFHSRALYRERQPAGSALSHDFLLEPCGRNTAPAIALAAWWALSHDPDAMLLVLPADHLIADVPGFAASVAQARQLAREGWLVTFGIQPERPETGFGYIQQGKALPNGHQVARFVEKPDLERARQYVDAGDYLWNAGMFCFRAQVILDALAQCHPELARMAHETWQSMDGSMQPVSLPATYATLPDISIDYAVMERAGNVAVVRAAFDWSDIGTWTSLSALSPADADGNRVVGEDVVLIGSRDCYVRAEGRLVAALGLEGIMVVDTPDALLVAHRDQAQAVKDVVATLRQREHPAYHSHRTVHRPWGSFAVLEEGERFKIKRIVVRPGASLSLQMHHHRAEHWVVVKGTAKVVNGSREVMVHANQSTYIPAGTPHRLVNPGVIDCVMIEVQVGDYVGEDDIVRFDDEYGRT